MARTGWKWAAGAALVLGTAAAGAQVVHVAHAPVVVVPAQPVRTWVPGHWAWHGHQRTWVQGHWIASAPRHGRGPQHWERTARRDQDRDGIPNRHDRDRDGDGVPNRWDRAPADPRWR